MEVGIIGKVEFVVVENCTAKALGSGALRVLATPRMIAGLEEAAWKSIQPYLNEGDGSVGTLMNVTHDAATPVGMKVTCKSELKEIDGRRLVFTVEAFDEAGRIGGGTHERFIVTNDRFQTKTDKKLEMNA